MKRVYWFFFALLLGMSLYSQQYHPIIKLFTPGFSDISIKQTIQFNLVDDSKEQGVGFSTIAVFDKKEFKFDLGINYTNKQGDFTAQLVYWPTFFNILNLGAGFTYHLYDYPFYFVEQDFLLDIYAKLRIGKYYMVWTRWGGMAKLTSIDGIKTFGKGFNSMNFNLVLTWFPSKICSCYFSFESNSYFNYPSFLTVFFNTGAEFEIVKNKFFAGLDLCTKSYDFVVATQSLSQMNLKVFGRYKI